MRTLALVLTIGAPGLAVATYAALKPIAFARPVATYPRPDLRERRVHGSAQGPNTGVPGSASSDLRNRALALALALALAKIFRFDMSNLRPAAFGGTVGQGEWKILQDFLKNPKNVTGTAAAFERAAAAAYKR